MLAVATAFSVIFVKEVFGGTGYNIFNVALVTRAVLFFGYPARMSGDKVFVSTNSICGLGYDLPMLFQEPLLRDRSPRSAAATLSCSTFRAM